MKIAFDIDDTIWKIHKEDQICKENPDKCDVDATTDICLEHRPKMYQIPDYDLIQVLRWFFNNGDTVYVWSAGGFDYAVNIVEKLGLKDMVEVITKGSRKDIDIAFDDMNTSLAKVDVRVRREHTKKLEELENMSIDELEHACTHCPTCDKKIVPDTESISVIKGVTDWDGHTYKYDCECDNKDIRLSIG